MATKKNPHRCHCEHATVRYCGDCKLVHCMDCKQEWSAAPCARAHADTYRWQTLGQAAYGGANTTLTIPASGANHYKATTFMASAPQNELPITNCSHESA